MNQSYVSFFKSIVDQDRAAVLNYEKWGGATLRVKTGTE